MNALNQSAIGGFESNNFAIGVIVKVTILSTSSMRFFSTSSVQATDYGWYPLAEYIIRKRWRRTIESISTCAGSRLERIVTIGTGGVISAP